MKTSLKLICIGLLCAVPLLSAPASALEKEHVASVALLPDNACGCTELLLSLPEGGTLSFHSPEFTANGILQPGEELAAPAILSKGESCLLHTPVSEGMPNLMICAGNACWTPSFNGMDGSLELIEGFKAVPSSENSPPLHYRQPLPSPEELSQRSEFPPPYCKRKGRP